MPDPSPTSPTTPADGGIAAQPSALSRRSALRALTAGALLLGGGGVVLRPTSADAAASVPQAGPVPVVIDQAVTTDNVTTLMGASSAHPSDLVVANSGAPWKTLWTTNFSGTTSMEWQVSVADSAEYHLYAIMAAKPGQRFLVSVSGTSSTAAFVTDGAIAGAEGWQRADIGTVTLPSGTSTITLTRTGTLDGDVKFTCLQLLRQSDVAAHRTRAAAARADTGWLADAGYGLMFQYGSWGFPNNVGAAKSLDQQADDFNVPQFIKMVKDTGAAYVVWSTCWWGYHLNAAISSVNNIVTQAGGPANPGLTSKRDLIGEIATACHGEGIRFMLYYHPGYEDSAWWNYQGWPSTTEWARRASADRSVFFRNWKTVVSEIGNRYGSRLDGWFFDDAATTYIGAKFEELHDAARSGNPKRLISWNPAGSGDVRITEFQDVYFGENHNGQVLTGSASAGGDGILKSGPCEGQLQHGMLMLDNDWGVHTRGQKIASSSAKSSDLIGYLNGTGTTPGAVARHVPLSFDLMMYEDGAVSDAALRRLNDVRQAVRGTPPATVPTGTTMVNDTDSGIVYTGSWQHSAKRGFGDHDDDVHYTTANGDSFSYKFDGTGIDVISERSDSQGKVDIYVDDAFVLTVDATSNTRKVQQVIYSARHLDPGTHTIKAVKKSGTYMILDALRVIPNPTTINDTHSSITYTGPWTHAGNRGGGDHGDDVHWTSTNGASATVTFTGTGIDVIAPMASGGYGTADVFLDDATTRVGTTDADNPGGSYASQQILYSLRHLTPGKHTLKLTKTSGQYLHVDAFRIWP